MSFTENEKIDGLLMLIDFEKAFDSISWKFLYNVLEYLGFTEEYVRWIKLLNTNFRATIVQAGCKSDFFKIERGCKQGDPIAAYLFIICAQILTYMIDQDVNIKGLFINKEIKLCQFADDTTLILDGSKQSLESALNIIETFGSFSGLKMNTTKTKLIWIGRKRYSREKLDTSSKLQWGSTTFNLLGIIFSVNLDDMPSLNYSVALEKSKILIANWKKRVLSPIGKITIIKTFTLSNFIHLLTTLPSPSKQFIKNVNELFFSFVWSNKPDKVKRIYITQDYQDGGLRMVNIENFITSLKIAWIKKLLTNCDAEYISLFEKTLSPLSKFFMLGSDWAKYLVQKTTNMFWKDVLNSWLRFIEVDEINGNIDILTSPIWYNPLISKETLYFPTWYQKGVCVVGDLIDEQGHILDQKEIEKRYTLKMSYLEYDRVRGLIMKFVRSYQKGNNFDFIRPCLQKNLAYLLLNKYGTKGIYNKINKSFHEMTFQRKWSHDIDIQSNAKSWQQIFRICFKTIEDPFYKWFQYRVIHRILGTQDSLFKMGISDSSTCLLCKQGVETLIHLFVLCPKSKYLWSRLENLILEKTSFQLKFSPKDILLGYRYQNPFSQALNTLIIVTKSYIFSSSRKCQQINIDSLLKVLKKIYDEQKLVKALEMENAKFEKEWFQMKKLFI